MSDTAKRVEGTNVLEEYFEDTTGLFVDETGDTLHTATTGETANRRLGNTYNAMSQ